MVYISIIAGEDAYLEGRLEGRDDGLSKECYKKIEKLVMCHQKCDNFKELLLKTKGEYSTY
jgi:hypothetical protein